MNVTLKYASAETLVPGAAWSLGTDDERGDRVVRALAEGEARFRTIIEIVAARADGQIIINLRESLPADRRGTLLLDLEEFLKDTVDPGLTVWLDALGDRNSLRNLRGIEVKSS
jgi:hypothetical protein